MGLGVALFVMAAPLSRDPRAALWFGAVGFPAASFPLLWVGRLPADMPPAWDPRVRQHPRYAEVARWGRIAGLAIAVLAVTEVVLSAVFVRGLAAQPPGSVQRTVADTRSESQPGHGLPTGACPARGDAL